MTVRLFTPVPSWCISQENISRSHYIIILLHYIILYYTHWSLY